MEPFFSLFFQEKKSKKSDHFGRIYERCPILHWYCGCLGWLGVTDISENFIESRYIGLYEIIDKIIDIDVEFGNYLQYHYYRKMVDI